MARDCLPTGRKWLLVADRFCRCGACGGMSRYRLKYQERERSCHGVRMDSPSGSWRRTRSLTSIRCGKSIEQEVKCGGFHSLSLTGHTWTPGDGLQMGKPSYFRYSAVSARTGTCGLHPQ